MALVVSDVLNTLNVKKLISDWILEDIPNFDYAGYAVGEQNGVAEIYIKDLGIVAGVPFINTIFQSLLCAIEWHVTEGQRVTSIPCKAATVNGPLKEILRGERLSLNILARASGIATLGDRLKTILKSAGWKGELAGTRKTTPGFRLVEKYAMLVAGVSMHRFDLSSLVMLKDNHVTASGGIKKAVEAVRKVSGFSLKIEVECQNLAEAKEAASAGADIVMLDNAKPQELASMSRQLKAQFPHVLIEASGGITEASLRTYALPCVDVISTSSLCQGYSTLDVSMKIVHRQESAPSNSESVVLAPPKATAPATTATAPTPTKPTIVPVTMTSNKPSTPASTKAAAVNGVSPPENTAAATASVTAATAPVTSVATAKTSASPVPSPAAAKPITAKPTSPTVPATKGGAATGTLSTPNSTVSSSSPAGSKEAVKFSTPGGVKRPAEAAPGAGKQSTPDTESAGKSDSDFSKRARMDTPQYRKPIVSNSATSGNRSTFSSNRDLGGGRNTGVVGILMNDSSLTGSSRGNNVSGRITGPPFQQATNNFGVPMSPRSANVQSAFQGSSFRQPGPGSAMGQQLGNRLSQSIVTIPTSINSIRPIMHSSSATSSSAAFRSPLSSFPQSGTISQSTTVLMLPPGAGAGGRMLGSPGIAHGFPSPNQLGAAFGAGPGTAMAMRLRVGGSGMPGLLMCRGCGNKNSAGMIFCGKCRRPLN